MENYEGTGRVWANGGGSTVKSGVEPAEETSLPRYQPVTVTLSSAPRSSSGPRAQRHGLLPSLSQLTPEWQSVSSRCACLDRGRALSRCARDLLLEVHVLGAEEPHGRVAYRSSSRATREDLRCFALTVRAPLAPDHGRRRPSCICICNLALTISNITVVSSII